jgi:hypothetical protein
MKRAGSFLVACLILVGSETCAFGAVSTVREDAESPFVSVSRSTLYGSLAGTVIGCALMLVTDKYDEDVFKVAFVGGTALGLGYGVYHVSTRPAAEAALIRVGEDRVAAVGVPALRVRPVRGGGVRVDASLFALRF